MKVIIPMAGLGTRMRPHTHSRPKPLVNVAGEPMLKYLLASLDAIEVEEWIFIVGYLGDQIEAFIEKEYDINATFIVQEELIGQAHAIHLTRKHLGGPAILLFSDTLFEADLSVLNDTDADGIAFVKEVDNPQAYGVVSLNDEGFITQFVEKPDTDENRNALIGLYYIRESNDMIKAIETQMERNQMTKGEFYIADAFQIMIEEGACFSTQNVDVWLDCGKPKEVLETNQYWLTHHRDNSAEVKGEGVAVIPPVYVDPTATIRNSVIGPYAAISAGCTVENSIIRNSILDVNATVEDMLLEDSLVGQNSEVEGDFLTLNIGDNSTVDL